jgi:hypothetical protein
MLKFDVILENMMTDQGFNFWKKLENKIPNVWRRDSSSTRKYHKDEHGNVASIEEHTTEMIFALGKILNVFEIKEKTREADLLFLAVALHDAAKYGTENPEERMHTVGDHDKIMADLIKNGKQVFLKYFSPAEVILLEQMVRMHSGIWSTDWQLGLNKWEDFNKYTLLVHLLDIFSSRNLIKMIDV